MTAEIFRKALWKMYNCDYHGYTGVVSGIDYQIKNLTGKASDYFLFVNGKIWNANRQGQDFDYIAHAIWDIECMMIFGTWKEII